jgi:Ca2+-binding EF-hand superfamily protein
MRRFLTLAGVLTALVLFAGPSFGDDEAKAKAKPKRNPEVLFKKLDADNDGKVSKEEFLKLGELGKGKLKDKPKLLDKMFQKLDANNDGFLTLEEFKKIGELRKKKQDIK